MKTKSILIATLALAAGTFALIARETPHPNESVGTKSESKAVWLTNYDEALAKAQRENKPLLVNFTGSDWCPPCIMLDRQTFSQAEFADYAAKNLVLVKVDFPRRTPLPETQQAANEALARQFGIRGFPTILVMTPEGREQGRLGFMYGGPSQFIGKIEAVIRN